MKIKKYIYVLLTLFLFCGCDNIEKTTSDASKTAQNTQEWVNNDDMSEEEKMEAEWINNCKIMVQDLSEIEWIKAVEISPVDYATYLNEEKITIKCQLDDNNKPQSAEQEISDYVENLGYFDAYSIEIK